MHTPTLQHGFTLIELLLAVAISAILLSGINDLVKIGLDAYSSSHTTNELTYQARFALERITNQARATAPKTLSTPAVNTTGDWFAPAGCVGAACVMYCRNASQQLIETTSADTACTGTSVIATHVSNFSATLPASWAAGDRPIALLSLTLTDGNTTISQSSSVRLGGGTQ